MASWLHDKRSKEMSARLLAVEQHAVSSMGGGPVAGSSKSMGQLVVESDGFAQFKKGARSSGQIEIGSFKASNIVSGTWTAGPDFLARIAAPPMPTLPLRALVPSFGTVSNMVEYAKETSATDGSGQARQAFKNLDTVLRTGGSRLELVVNTTVLVADVSNFSELNQLFTDFFPKDPPARMTMQVPLPKGLLISIGCVAMVED